MKMDLFSVYDDKAVFFGNPFPAHTPAEAIRMFAASAKNVDTSIAHHPEDFSLYKVGGFDGSSGLLEIMPPPLFLSRASDLVAKSYDRESVKNNNDPVVLEVNENHG